MQGEVRRAVAFIVRSIGMIVAEVKVRRAVAGGLGQVWRRRSASWLWCVHRY